MTAKKNKPMEPAANREIVISRVVDAPQELVWQAMTDPKHVVQWWGPRGFSMTIETMEVRVGGIWKHVMHGPDGTDYPNKSVFTEVSKPERLCFSHGGGAKGQPGVTFDATWTFETVEASKTRVTIRMVFPTAEARDAVVKAYGAIEGGHQTLERLSEHLPTMSDAAEFVISRIFDAAPKDVWAAWTEPARMVRWWGPRIVKTPVCELDVRPGGKYRVVMRTADGMEYPITGVYREVVPPSKLVFTMDCSEHPGEWHDMVDPNRKGNPNPAGEMLATVTFEKQERKTKLTLRIQMKSSAICDNMKKMGLNEGWSESLDRLGQELAIK